MMKRFAKEIKAEFGVDDLSKVSVASLKPHQQVMLARFYFLVLKEEGHPEIGVAKLEAWQIYKLIHYPNGGYVWYVDSSNKSDTYSDNKGVLDILDETGGTKKPGKDGKVTDGDAMAKVDGFPNISEETKIPVRLKKTIKCGDCGYPDWFK